MPERNERRSARAGGGRLETAGDAAPTPAGAEACPASGPGTAFHPLADDYVTDPYPQFRRVRATEPVFYSAELDYWVVARAVDIVAVLRDPETFSPAIAREPVAPLCPAALVEAAGLRASLQRALVDEDPGTHQQHRRLFGEAFTARRVNRMEPAIRRIVNRYVDRFAGDGRADLVAQLLYPVPALVIFLLLGAPDDEDVLAQWLGSRRVIDEWWRPTDSDQVAMVRAVDRRWSFTRALVDAALKEPGDNYLGDMVRLHRGDPGLFTVNYLYNVMFLIQTAGHETTTQAASNGIRALLADRAQWARVCADPSLVPNAVEEILRFDTSVVGWRRIATRGARIGDRSIPAGAKILLLLGSANHDEAVFERGETFDVGRADAGRHLAFGAGTHFCMGAPLARLEMKILLEELGRRLPHMRLAEEQAWEYVTTLTFRGLRHLRVEWEVDGKPRHEHVGWGRE